MRQRASGSMTMPLILITPFAVILGWIGIPKAFPVIGGIIPNYMEEWQEPYMAEYLGVHLAHPDFVYLPLLVGFTVALGGLFVGWLIYRNGLQKGQIDPMRKWLGPVWMLFHNKYYVDELYNATVVPFTLGFSQFLAYFDDVWVIDPIVDSIGRLACGLAVRWRHLIAMWSTAL